MRKKLSAIAAVIFIGASSLSCSPESGSGPGAAESATASSMDIALAAYERADYPMALSIFRAQAEQGNARAQHILGVMYFNGQGVEPDFATAARWHRMAAEGGVVRAQFVLGMMHFNGRGVPQDDAEAARWFRMAADRGGARAQYNLGLMYEAGRGVAQDDEEALRLFQRAAGQGHAGALAKIGQTPEDASGVNGALIDDAAIDGATGDAIEGATNGVAVETVEAPVSLSPPAVVHAPETQIALVETAAANLSSTAPETPLETLAETAVPPAEAPTMADAQSAFESGDFATAASQFQILAEQGDARAQYTLAVMYANGQGVGQDDGQAVLFYRMAANQGHAAAQYDLGLMHANGRGVPADEMLALGFYRLAADQGHGAAQSNFTEISARVLEEGNAAYGRADYAAALSIFQSLADLGDAPAQHNLGIMYENGLGVGQDAAAALRWYRLAAEQEFAPAQARLNAP